MSRSIVAQGSRAVTLTRAIDAIPGRLHFAGLGAIGYYVSATGRNGPPLVLLHGINAAASSSEMRPLFDAFRDRPVYAMDWPGFGISERPATDYRPGLFSEALSFFLRSVVTPDSGPADVIALSLGAEFAARTALEQPESIRSLVLLSPTGLARVGHDPGRLAALVQKLDDHPAFADLFYALLTSPLGLRYLLGKSFEGPVDATLARQAHENARQPGARHAPLAFLRGELATRNAYDMLYRRLRVPTFVIHDRDPLTSFERLPNLTRENPFVRALRISPTRGLPHFDRPNEVEHAIRAFYDAIDAAENVESRIETVPVSVDPFDEATRIVDRSSDETTRVVDRPSAEARR